MSNFDILNCFLSRFVDFSYCGLRGFTWLLIRAIFDYFNDTAVRDGHFKCEYSFSA